MSRLWVTMVSWYVFLKRLANACAIDAISPRLIFSWNLFDTLFVCLSLPSFVIFPSFLSEYLLSRIRRLSSWLHLHQIFRSPPLRRRLGRRRSPHRFQSVQWNRNRLQHQPCSCAPLCVSQLALVPGDLLPEWLICSRKGMHTWRTACANSTWQSPTHSELFPFNARKDPWRELLKYPE